MTSLRFRTNTGTVVCALILLALPLFCCAQATPPASSDVPLRQEFKLKIGQKARVKGENLSVKFTSVVEDSRCPKGEQCIRQGSAKIRLEVTRGEDKPVTLELYTAPGAQEATLQEYTLTLIALNPYPMTSKQPDAADYQAMLVVDKNRAGGSQRDGGPVE